MEPGNRSHVEMPPTFERVEEHKAVLENMAGLNSRRQNANNIYVGLNTIFLTALGIFISTHMNLMMWDAAIALAILTFPILVRNAIWRKALNIYGEGGEKRYEYLREIEYEFRTRRELSGEQSKIGLFIRLEDIDRLGVIHYEKLLATFFLWFYPFASALLILLTFLVQNRVISSLTFP